MPTTGTQDQQWGTTGVQGQQWGTTGVQGQQWRTTGVQGQLWGTTGTQGQQWGLTGVQGEQIVGQDIRGITKSAEIVEKYYNKLPISQLIGGAISLDEKPFGWPLDRPVAPSAWSVPNIYVCDVVVYHQDVPVTVVPKTLII